MLWPESARDRAVPHRVDYPPFMRDLGITSILDHVYAKLKFVSQAQDLFSSLCEEVDVIQYRLDIVEDLLALPSVTKSFTELLPKLERLTQLRRDQQLVQHLNVFQQIAYRLEVLSDTFDCIEHLYAALSRVECHLRSSGLRTLLEYLDAVRKSGEYQALTEELPRLLRSIEQVRSVTIGLNLSGGLRPVEATILSIDAKPFKPRPLLTRLFGYPSEDQAYHGIGPFHSVFKGRPGTTALEEMMFDDLAEVFFAATKPVEDALSRCTRDIGQFLIALESAIRFYLGGVVLIRELQKAGVPVCKPDVAPLEERVCDIEGVYDVNLALELLKHSTDLSERIVLNDVCFGPQGRILILTGPNQGGKTTYTRAIGVAQVLFQAGLYVPGKRARMSPVDWIHTHFLADEIPNSEEGKLAEECRRMAAIFERATRYSLILLNESLSSTSPGESFYLTEGVVKGLRMTGCRAIFTTHLHDLAARANDINAETPGDSTVISVVAGLVEDPADTDETSVRRRSYQIQPGPPQGSSFALDIARRYGISLEQIVERIEKRKGANDAGGQYAVH